MPQSSRRNKAKRSRHSPNRRRRAAQRRQFAQTDISRPRIKPRTWKKIRRWGLYVVLVTAALAIIAGILVADIGNSIFGGGGVGDTGTGDRVGEEIVPMPIIYRPSNHIAPGSTYEGDYNSTPPTSGPHWDTGWAGCGFIDEGAPDEQMVHNMEHGQVIISYNLSDDGDVERLKEIAGSLPGRRSWMIMRPYTKIGEGQIALTAWGWKDEFSIAELTEERVREFYDAHRNNSGIESIPCGGFMS